MSRRKKESALEVLFEIVAMLPWWAGVGLAVVAYFGLHMVASSPLSSTSPGRAAGLPAQVLFRGLAGPFQYFVPLVLLIGAGLSAARRLTGRTNMRNKYGGARTAPPAPVGGAATVAESVNSDALWKASPAETAPRPDKWSLELLRAIDWKRFEEVCAEYFRVCGFHATTKSHGPDGGIDVILYAPQDKSKVVNVVQCKQWKRQVGPKLLRELLGVMTDMKVERGVFVTSSMFNDEAGRIAHENRIHLIDGPAFLEQILKRSAADQQRLLSVATEGDYLTPSCPSCGTKLVRRESKKDRSSFWGCSNHPSCRYTLNTAA
jgi:restriction system protein